MTETLQARAARLLEARKKATQGEWNFSGHGIIVGNDFIIQNFKRPVEDQRFIVEAANEACDIIRDYQAENAALRERLEIDYAYNAKSGERIPAPEGMPDGLACRDATIKMLDEEIGALQDELKNQCTETEHFARLACDDLGKNPPVFWKDKCEALQQENPRLREAIMTVRRQYQRVNRALAGKVNNYMKTIKLDPDMPAAELRLHMGELTASELRAARSAIRWANSQIQSREITDKVYNSLRQPSTMTQAVTRHSDSTTLSVLEDTMIFPKSFAGKYEKRTEYMDGWNDAVMDITRRLAGAPANAPSNFFDQQVSPSIFMAES